VSLQRRLKILEFALGALWRRRARNGAILAVFTLVGTLLLSVLLLVASLKEETARLLAAAPDLVVQRVWAGRHDLAPEAWAARIAREPGVGSARPRLWGYYYDAFSASNFTVMEGGGATGTLALLAGRLPAAEDECALGAGVAAARGVDLGAELTLIDARAVGTVFTVVGIFEAPSRLLTNDLVVLDRRAIASFFAFPEGTATDIAVQVRNPAEIENLARKVKRFFPDARPISRAEMLRTYDAVFSWRSGMLLAAFSGAVLAFCVLAWDKATGLSAEERREIGILKALGWDTADVLAMKVWEGVAIASLAVLGGLCLAWVHVFHLRAAVLGPILRGWSVLFPPLQLTPRVDWLALAEAGFLLVVPYVAATVVPSWKAAAGDPDAAMRS
jgi:hypothetical protein